MAEAGVRLQRQSVLPDAIRLADVQCRIVGPLARFVLRGDALGVRRVSDLLETSVPAVMRAVSAGERTILWQGPDEFLILAPDADRTAMHAQIAAVLKDHPHSLVDVSQRNVALGLEGAAIEPLLATGIMLDLCEAEFPVGMVTRTLFGKADVTLWRQATDRFHLEVWRSFAPYVLGLLQAGSRGL